jgi:hypothetical protein
MPVDDDTLVSTTPAPDADAPARRSNRGFWLVTGSIAFACVFVLIEIFANFGTKDTIAHAEHTLRTAEAAADHVVDAEGSIAGVGASRMTAIEPTLLWVDGDTASTGLDVVSFATSGAAWGAAVQARPGACFYIHETGPGEVFYGVGTECTGARALDATDPRW